MEIKVIKQGNFKVDKAKNFRYLVPNDDEVAIQLAIQPFLITTASDVILLDVGLGFIEDHQPIIIKRLLENNVDPSSITKILLSHLHKDHTDGLGYFKNDVFIQNFPKATIHIQKREFEYALQKIESLSYDNQLLNALATLSNVEWMTDDAGSLSSEITFEVTGGHTPYHQVFWIKENNETVFYGADNLPTYGHLKRHIAFKTDYDGHKAMELRKIWEQQAKQNHWTVLLYHDMKQAIVTL